MDSQTTDPRPSLRAVSGLEYPDQRQPDPREKDQQQEKQQLKQEPLLHGPLALELHQQQRTTPAFPGCRPHFACLSGGRQ